MFVTHRHQLFAMYTLRLLPPLAALTHYRLCMGVSIIRKTILLLEVSTKA